MSHERNGKGAVEAPDPEVEPRAVRRRFTGEYKRRILDEIDHAREPGEIGAILRREGLYSQLISKWRVQRERDRLEPQPRGPKPDREKAEIARLKRENERLREKLEKAELIIEVQKKVSLMYGQEESEPSTSPRSRD